MLRDQNSIEGLTLRSRTSLSKEVSTLPKLVRGILEISEIQDVAFFQYKMLLKDYIYRVKVDQDGSFEAILRDIPGENSVELLKREFKVREIRDIIDLEKLEV